MKQAWLRLSTGMRRWSLRLVLALILAVVLLQLWYLGWVLWWKYQPPHMTRFMELRLAELRIDNPAAQLKHSWRAYAQISSHLKRAVVASEDDSFTTHQGFDWEGIQLALEKNQRRGKPVAGGSTISQQLAKNLFLSPSKTPLRKIQEAIITLMLESLWDKRRILEVYLNSVEWGEGVFGAEAAARHYYKLSASQLSAAQAARLAVLLPAPRRYGRNPYSPYVNRRSQQILGRMHHSAIP